MKKFERLPRPAPAADARAKATQHKARELLWHAGLISTRENADCYGRIEGRLPVLVRQLEEAS